MNSDKKISKYHTLIYVAAFFVFYFPLNYFISSSAELGKSLMGSLVESLVFSLIMGLIFTYFSNPNHQRKLDAFLNSKLKENENLLLETLAGKKDYGIVFGGKLYLTDQRLLFVKNDYALIQKVGSIEREDISQIQPAKLYLIVDNGIEITSKSGKKQIFNMQNRDEVLQALRESITIKP